MRSLAEAPDAAARVPEGVKEVIGRRLDRLPPPALETLTLAAVLGIDFRLCTLRIVASELELDELIASLEAAVAARLVVEDPEEVDRFSFAHALVRETLYERPITSRRLRLHLRVARGTRGSAVAQCTRPSSRITTSRRGMSAAPRRPIVHSLKAAEAALAVHAYEEAAEQYERALAALEIVEGDDAAARCDVMLALGAARWQASRPDRSSTFMQAIELARGLGSADRLAQAALGAGGRFYAPGAIDLRRDRVARRGARRTSAGRQRASRAGPGTPGREPRVRRAEARARELADEAVDMARRLGEPEALAAALVGQHAALLHADHAKQRRRLAEEALAVAGELGALRDVRARTPLAALRSRRARRAGRGAAAARRARAPRRRPPPAAVPACVARVAVRVDRTGRPL